MARRVFFSFHHERDKGRIGQIRNSNVVLNDGIETPFVDAAAWEKVKRQGDKAIADWIEKNLHGTSVTVVLIGAETATREWVLHEIDRSCDLKKGLLGIWIHKVKCFRTGLTDSKGENPFDQFQVLNPTTNRYVKMSNYVSCYDWVKDKGRENIANWIEQAVEDAGR